MNRSTKAYSYDALVDEIYSTGSEHHDWQNLLGRVAGFVGAQSGIMGVSNVSTGNGEPENHSYGLSKTLLYERWRGEFAFEDCSAGQGYAPKQGEVRTGVQLLDPTSSTDYLSTKTC